MRRVVLVIFLVFNFSILYGETVDEIDKRAELLYNDKRFSDAIREWLIALDIDPANEKIQQKIELVYEEKHKKNMALQISRSQMRDASNNADTLSANELEKLTTNSFNNFVIAYRIDPNDPELKMYRERMQKFQLEMQSVIEKKRRSDEDKRIYAEAIAAAELAMKEKRFEAALDNYNSALEVFENDPVATEGKRNADLAVSNRIRYEKIQLRMANGIELFNVQKYDESLVEFKEIISLDPNNVEADNYITKINDIKDSRQNYERKRQQAEQFYQSGIENIAVYKFNEARDDLENALGLIPNYKDTRQRIDSIKRLRDEYNQRMQKQRLEEIDREFEGGLIYFAQGRYKDALSSFERTMVIDPKNVLAKDYLERAKEALNVQQEEFVDESSPYFSIINSLTVSGIDLYKRGMYQESRDRWEKIRGLFPNNKIAIEYLLKCDLKLNPERFKGLADRIISEGKSALEKKEYRRALSLLEMIQSVSPNYPDIDKLIAMAKKPGRTNNTQSGGQVYVSQAEIDKRYNTAIDLYRKGGDSNIRTAIDNLKFIAQNDPENMKALIALNKIESERRAGTSGDFEQSSGSKLSDRQKQLVNEHLYKGISYYSSNQFDKAIEEWRKVLAIDPNNEKAKTNIRKTIVILNRENAQE